MLYKCLTLKLLKNLIFMKQTIKKFVDDFSAIRAWFLYQPRESKEIIELYQTIKTMWSDYRELFPNKGTYKTVRRLFIKYAAAYYSTGTERWRDLPEDLFAEIIYKGRQCWLPQCDVFILLDYLRRDLWYDNNKESYRYLIGLFYIPTKSC